MVGCRTKKNVGYGSMLSSRMICDVNTKKVYLTKTKKKLDWEFKSKGTSNGS